MNVITTAPSQVMRSSQQWQAASRALLAGEVHRVKVPTAKVNERPTIAQYVQNLPIEQLQGFGRSNIVVNLHFNAHHETQVALEALRNALPPSAAIPPITITQGAAGGALIGGLGGLGVAALLQGLKSTADAFGNPILSTLGTVLVGIAVGAAGGAAYAKTTEYSLSVGKTGVTVTAGTQNKSEKPKP